MWLPEPYYFAPELNNARDVSVGYRPDTPSVFPRVAIYDSWGPESEGLKLFQVRKVWAGLDFTAPLVSASDTPRVGIETMKKSAKALRRWFAVVAMGLGLATANATTVIPPTFEEMTDRAELIFVGKVVSSRAEWRTVGTNRVIFTVVEFERQEVLKGEAGKTVTLQFLGGTIGDVTLEIAGVPKFNTGYREFLFVERNGVQFCPLVGAFHGKFGVRKDQKSGRDILVRYNGKPLHDVAEIEAGAGAEFGPKRARPSISANAEPLSVDDFKSRIRDRLANRAR